MQIIYLIKIILLLLLKIKGVKVSIINKIPYSFNKTDIKKKKFSAIRFYLFCLGSRKSKSLSSRRSKAKFDRTDGHIGNEISLVVNTISSREY
jgi:hypothetical protein